MTPAMINPEDSGLSLAQEASALLLGLHAHLGLSADIREQCFKMGSALACATPVATALPEICTGPCEDSDESLDLRDDWEKLVEENAALNRNLVRHREAIRRLAEERHLAQRVADEITQIVKDVECTP